MRRATLYILAWAGAAAGAVGLGFLAVSLLGSGVAASPSSDSTAVASAAGSPTNPTATPAPAANGERSTEGGTVFATCSDGVLSLASAPATGWWVDDSPDVNEVEFENGASKIEVYAACTPGGPSFTVEGPRVDDDSGGSSSSATDSEDSGRDGDDDGGDDSPSRDDSDD